MAKRKKPPPVQRKVEVFKTWLEGNPTLGHWDVFNPLLGKVVCFETYDEALDYVRSLI